MQNMVPLGTGNSRFMKSNIPASTTLQQLIQMLNNGTFPYDVGAVNPAGVSQQGDPLNKATLLADATAALFGLGTDAVPDDVLQLLANNLYNGLGNQYVWEKSVYVESLTAVGKTELFKASSSGYSVSVQWSDSINVDSSGGVTLNNPQTIVFDGIDENTKWNSLKGNYAVFNEEVFKFSEDATFSSTTGGGYDTKFVASGGYTVGSVLAHESYVNSDDADAYPPAEPDGYVYTPLGQLGNKVQIETGSYVGTGTAGSDNPNTLTFGFAAKLVIVFLSGTKWAMFINNNTSGNKGVSATANYGNNAYTFSGNSVSWYSNSANYQLNDSGTDYYYIAIG